MLSYSLKCRNNAESKNSNVVKSKNGKIMLSLKCYVCKSKKPKFIKQQEASGVLRSLGIKAPLSKILFRSTFLLELLKS